MRRLCVPLEYYTGDAPQHTKLQTRTRTADGGDAGRTGVSACRVKPCDAVPQCPSAGSTLVRRERPGTWSGGFGSEPEHRAARLIVPKARVGGHRRAHGRWPWLGPQVRLAEPPASRRRDSEGERRRAAGRSARRRAGRALLAQVQTSRKGAQVAREARVALALTLEAAMQFGRALELRLILAPAGAAAHQSRAAQLRQGGSGHRIERLRLQQRGPPTLLLRLAHLWGEERAPW